MKRLFTTIVSILLINGVSYAGLITHTDYTSGNVITASGQNSNENTIVNEFNGNIDNTNIKASAGITMNKLNAMTASVVPMTDANGFLTTGVPYILPSTMTITGNIKFTDTTQYGIVGSTDSDTAGAGYVGEYISSGTTNSQVITFGTGVFGDAVSINLTPGDWDVNLLSTWNVNPSVTTGFNVGISSTSGNSSAGLDGVTDSAGWSITSSMGQTGSISIVNMRVSITSTTTYYGKEKVTFSGGLPQASLFLYARRRR